MDQKKLRECLGLFGTGVVIACARKKNFLTENLFSERVFDKKIFDKSFFPEGTFKKLSEKLSDKFLQNFSHNFAFGQNLLQKLKKVFADEFFGMTINSFTSVSLEPPLVMFCVDHKSSNLKLFRKNRYFSLNILSHDQLELAKAFATPKNSTKWGVEPYFFGHKGNPIFHNSLGFCECKEHRVVKAGDHYIIIGEVLDFAKINDKKPLLYYRGKFTTSE